MKIGSLFSGIGGLERGVEAAVLGARVIWQAECDPHALAVLAQHYPDVRRYDDVKEIDSDAERPDLICGGFPCQDISNAGNRAGIDGERSGLWREYARIVRVLRPRFVFVENVAALLGRGLDRVLGDLAACGYDAVWETFRAADVGAPHRRDRLFLLAYGGSEFLRIEPGRLISGWAGATEPGNDRASLADADREAGGRASRGAIGADGRASVRAGEEESGRRGGDVADAMRSGQWAGERNVCAGKSDPHGRGEDLADANGPGRQGQVGHESSAARGRHPAVRGQEAMADSDSDGREGQRGCGVLDRERPAPGRHPDRCNCPRCYVHRFPPGPDALEGWPGPQPAVRRSDDGVPGRSHRLRLLGNAVVPQQATLAFLTLLAAARRETERAA